jgi:hypothetical protein
MILVCNVSFVVFLRSSEPSVALEETYEDTGDALQAAFEGSPCGTRPSAAKPDHTDTDRCKEDRVATTRDRRRSDSGTAAELRWRNIADARVRIPPGFELLYVGHAVAVAVVPLRRRCRERRTKGCRIPRSQSTRAQVRGKRRRSCPEASVGVVVTQSAHRSARERELFADDVGKRRGCCGRSNEEHERDDQGSDSKGERR